MSKVKQDVIKAVKTFIQTGVAVMLANGSGYANLGTLKTAAIAGGAAVLSFVQNQLTGAEVSAEAPQTPRGV